MSGDGDFAPGGDRNYNPLDPPAEIDRIEGALAAARRRLELMIEAAGATCHWDWDLKSNILKGDTRFAVMTRQDPLALADGLRGSAFFAAIHPDDAKRIRIAVAGIMGGAEIFSKEYRLLKDDGGFRWVHAQGHTEYDDEQPVRFLGTLVDITAQKITQEQLRVAQVAGGVGTFEHIAGFGTVKVSEQFCRLFGLYPTRILPVGTLNSLIDSEDIPIIDLTHPDGHQNVTDIEFRITRADDGQQRWLARRGEYVDDPSANGRRYIGVIFDVTEAKRTEEKLREANTNLVQQARESARERNRVWQNAQDPLVVVQADGQLIDVNPAFSDMLGEDAEACIGKSLFDYTLAEDVSVIRDGIAKATEHDHTEFEVRHMRGDQSIRAISWMTSHEGPIVYAYGRDITLEKVQAEALRETENQLRQSQKMEAVGQLTGGIAHDFNNMLTGVIASLAIMKRRIAAGNTSDLDRFMDAATTSAHRAAALTHRLLAFSRRQPLDPRPTDVNKLITSMEDLLRRTLGEQIALSIALETTTERAITDSNQLENAILNLVINARDAMPDGGKLTIETNAASFTTADLQLQSEFQPGRFIVIAVSDNGTGMSPETIARAYEPFFTTKPIGQGTGLGLSMIYGFAQQSGGHVRIYSEVGLGTTIKLYLPSACASSEAEAASDNEEPAAPMGDGETVMVVEDDDAVRMLVVEVLTELGYTAVQAVDGDTALPILESKRRIDLLISDVGLPGLNGRQLAEIALAARPKLKVLFITGYAAKAALRGEFLAPGMDMITKPFSIDELAQKINEIISARS